ncbi:MAG TPA: 1-deoxy-D-xylulose-5-phosphate synthase [Clostridiales bacterium UBA8960]|jgi:1-deoxy-D-xylulose-5-phosphate synthase|nr:1-deoxy-D-xylulose-5-phosphate synthase [Clostridiales bacterium UBA8960]
MYRFLSALNGPDDIKEMTFEEQTVLAYEIRQFLIESISETGGHLASNLGVVELTIALHTVFNSPTDKFIWDVGHQSYVHKLLTGRMEGFKTLRQFKGMSGFPKRYESVHDHFDTGHSSTSISAGVGMALARDLKGEKHEVISIIGDGALTGGMAFEALNYLGHSKTNVKVILNDNEMSISQNVGGVSIALNELRTNQKYYKLKGKTKNSLLKFPSLGEPIVDMISKIKDSFKYFVVDGGVFFEEIGLTYIGPINGHDIKSLMKHMEMMRHVEGPVVLHVITQKGKGYPFAEAQPNKYHGVGKFDASVAINAGSKLDYSKVFGDQLVKLADENPLIVAVSAAMIDGTGLTEFALKHPNKVFDVAIAEQHAVTMAAGMALQGVKPFVALYSTFLQRAYDQVVHDVCIQNAPVVLCIDRAGLVGNDGETHHGILDISYLSHIPNIMILSPKDANELEYMMAFAANYQKGPIAIRYPRGISERMPTAGEMSLMPEHVKTGSKLLLIATGKMVKTALCASEAFAEGEVGVLNLRKIKPLDEALLLDIIKGYDCVVTLEDHAIKGGMGENILSMLNRHQIDKRLITLGIGDVFVEHGEMDHLLESLNLHPEGVVETLKEVLHG